MFVDVVRIYVESGAGGKGCVSFRREKYVPHGGPDGGDGGNGGNVILEADENLMTLLDLQNRRYYKAQNGAPGSGKKRHGRNGKDLIIKVPVGTQVFDDKTDELLGDLVRHGAQLIVCYGGLGGRGNARFATSTNQAPRFAEEGEKGESKEIRLELKLLAEVGIIGFPNVGKSTLLSKISKAHPKIGDYPFTTLYPNLGVVRVDEFRSFVAADIPGIVEHAHSGVGLGDRFLRHIERTKILIHLLEPAHDALYKFHALNKELRLYNQELSAKPQIIVINKMDLPGAEKEFEKIKKVMQSSGIEPIGISAITGKGIKKLIQSVAYLLEKMTPQDLIRLEGYT
jgi:GTP-binding protein